LTIRWLCRWAVRHVLAVWPDAEVVEPAPVREDPPRLATLLRELITRPELPEQHREIDLELGRSADGRHGKRSVRISGRLSSGAQLTSLASRSTIQYSGTACR